MDEGFQQASVLKNDAFSTVLKMWCPGRKKPVIVKKVKTSTRSETEIEVLKSLEHPGIPKFITSFTNDDTTCIIMEYKKGLTLDRAFAERDFSEADVRYVLKQLVNITHYLHTTKKIVHRDIKPQNVIVDEFNNVSLIDFEFANFITDMTEMVATPSSCEPEVISRTPYNKAGDVWSLGVLAYSLMAESQSFGGKSVEDIFKCICVSDPVLPMRFRKQVSANFIDFLKYGLSKNPVNRPTIDKLASHPWLSSSMELTKGRLMKSADIFRPVCVTTGKSRKGIIRVHCSNP